MSMEKIYKCNICREILKNPVHSYGVNFSNLDKFTLGGYQSTDGQHICFDCAVQLRIHLSSEPISKELIQHEKQTTLKYLSKISKIDTTNISKQ